MIPGRKKAIVGSPGLPFFFFRGVNEERKIAGSTLCGDYPCNKSNFYIYEIWYQSNTCRYRAGPEHRSGHDSHLPDFYLCAGNSGRP